ncbi:hypothetical protein ONZ45_g12158 [Pleurotus djamor]|nr:hypothetical protein ONZ45_g12158 [Pleurotus djamor]
MNASPITALDADLDMMFNELVERNPSKERHEPSSQMPTPPHTPLTPPPMMLSTRSNSTSELPMSPPPPKSPTIGASPPADNTLVSIATSFHPSAGHGDSPPDLVLLSSDSVFFYVHKAMITPSTTNNFGGFMLRTDRSGNKVGCVDGSMDLVMLPDSSPVLNIILHILRRWTFA